MQPQLKLQDIRKPTAKRARRKPRRKTTTRTLKELIKTVSDAKTPVIVFPNVSSFRSVARRLPGSKKKITKAYLKRGAGLVRIDP